MKKAVKKNLTFQNSLDKGYEYVKDIVYNPNASGEVTEKVLKALKTNNYVMGKPAWGKATNNFVGLYKKIEK